MKDVEKVRWVFKNVWLRAITWRISLSRMQRLNPSNPLRIVINSATRVPTASPSQRPSQPPPRPAHAQPPPPPPAHAQPRSTPAPTHNFASFIAKFASLLSEFYKYCFIVAKGEFF
ncbi:hypothetical protein CFP56_036380 [Quercus suber]|uniref:Uncharacterized protein n=1 Tax=Quercus suber TaxID=58331 RepID=A0AAW0LQS1_QUESU